MVGIGAGTAAAIAAGVGAVGAIAGSAIQAGAASSASSAARKQAMAGTEMGALAIGQYGDMALGALNNVMPYSEKMLMGYKQFGDSAMNLISMLLMPAGATDSFKAVYLPEANVSGLSPKQRREYAARIAAIGEKTGADVPNIEDYKKTVRTVSSLGKVSTAEQVYNWDAYGSAIRAYNAGQKAQEKGKAALAGEYYDPQYSRYIPGGAPKFDVDWNYRGKPQQFNKANESQIEEVRSYLADMGDNNNLRRFNDLLRHPVKNKDKIQEFVAGLNAAHDQVASGYNTYQSNLAKAREAAAPAEDNPMQFGPGGLLHNFDWKDFQKVSGFEGTMNDLFKPTDTHANKMREFMGNSPLARPGGMANLGPATTPSPLAIPQPGQYPRQFPGPANVGYQQPVQAPPPQAAPPVDIPAPLTSPTGAPVPPPGLLEALQQRGR